MASNLIAMASTTGIVTPYEIFFPGSSRTWYLLRFGTYLDPTCNDYYSHSVEHINLIQFGTDSE